MAPALSKKFRVLVVDDSAFMRKVLESIFATDEQLTVIGHAKDGQEVGVHRGTTSHTGDAPAARNRAISAKCSSATASAPASPSHSVPLLRKGAVRNVTACDASHPVTVTLCDGM